MAALDDRIEKAFGRLREELSLFRLANDRFDRRLAAAMNPAITLYGIRVPQPISFARAVRGWLIRCRNFWIRKNRNAARRVDE